MKTSERLLAAVLVSLGLALTGCNGEDAGDIDADEEESTESSADALAGEGYAQMIRKSNRIHLTTVHTSGVRDNADAKQNIDDIASGRKAATSAYGDARGKRVAISLGVLRGMWQLSTKFTYTVSEIAGGDHGYGSLHYRGRAIDIASINGRRVGNGAPHSAFMRMCRSLGADEVLGPGDADHSTHVHCGWR